MKLAPAVGNLKLQQALSHTYVRDIVNFLLTHETLLPDIAEILQTCVQTPNPLQIPQTSATLTHMTVHSRVPFAPLATIGITPHAYDTADRGKL
jgi:hypothetical protein